MSGPRISADRTFRVDELSIAIENLILAFSVAHIGTSIEALERCLADGRRTREDLVSALAAELEKSASGREHFLAEFQSSLQNELGHLLGLRAGDAIFHALQSEVRAGDLKAIIQALPDICSRLHRPLTEYLEAQRRASQLNSRLIQAIADQGIESIDAFKMIENLQAARTEAAGALERLTKAG